ncbi:MAG: ATP-binding protein [Salibacteraceae bacterium]
MITEKIKANAEALNWELQWFSQVLEFRLLAHQGKATEVKSIADIPPPDLEEHPSLLGQLVVHYEMNFAERLLLMLALIPEIKPDLLDPLSQVNNQLNRGYTEFGGYQGRVHGGFLPTGETAIFLMAGDQLFHRIELRQLFREDHFFYEHNILRLERDELGEPTMSAPIAITLEYLELLTSGEEYQPPFSMKFPARKLSTSLNWQELVLENSVRQELEEINGWIKYGTILLNDWGLSRKVKPGYRALFYGNSGTGKTLAATLLGQENNTPVYRVDMSSLISKYIGETEKNLASLFDQARTKKWILFFDEADALFGKRTEARSSNDRSANQQVGYLLQRVEAFPGVVILASNLKKNIDPAFTRRFDSMIHFPIPGPAQRYTIWQNNFQKAGNKAGEKATKPYFQLEKAVNLRELANRYELTGGNIVNILRFSAIRAISRNSKTMLQADLMDGIKKELRKEGRTA